MLELQTLPAPRGLEVLGTHVELREIPYGEVREALARAPSPELAGETVLVASLVVDGEHWPLERLLALPGRFSGAILRAVEACNNLHGMRRTPEDDEPTPAQGASPGEA